MRKSYAKRRPGGRRGRSRYGRRSFAKRRSPRKMSHKRGLTRKRILNMVSVKKRDRMLMRSSTDGGVSFLPEAVAGSTNNCALYLMTGRGRSDVMSNGTANRGSHDVFWKGFSDHLLIQSTTSDPWKWRRIVFEVHAGGVSTGVDPTLYLGDIGTYDIDPLQPSTASHGEPVAPITAAGVKRYFRQMSFLSNTNMNNFLGGLFGGTVGYDFNPGQFVTARLQNENIKIHSDVTRTITSGNDSGVMKTYKIYHSLNKTMRYAGNEVGNLMSSTYYAAPKSPLGDVYVCDLFTQLNDAPGSLRITGQGCAYWHER
uniref:Capsid protein n=1 Tax=Genomoviridae sp. TaxID=2202565 RepID=A0A858NFX9_9VIRU|nr:MAG: capsid protein [Genomoviridae sp.]